MIVTNFLVLKFGKGLSRKVEINQLKNFGMTNLCKNVSFYLVWGTKRSILPGLGNKEVHSTWFTEKTGIFYLVFGTNRFILLGLRNKQVHSTWFGEQRGSFYLVWGTKRYYILLWYFY